MASFVLNWAPAVHAGRGGEEALLDLGRGVDDLDDVRPPRPARVVASQVGKLGSKSGELCCTYCPVFPYPGEGPHVHSTVVSCGVPGFVKWEHERVDLTSYNVTTQYVAHSDCTTEGASLLQYCSLVS